jgi:mycothiol synthase
MKNSLSPEFYNRPAVLKDAQAAVDLFDAYDMSIVGVRIESLDNTIRFWQTPGMELNRDTTLVMNATQQVVGYAEVYDVADPHVHIFTFGCVHPDYTGRGIGTYLVDWIDQRMREGLYRAPEGARVVAVQFLPVQAQAGAALLQSHGFELVRGSYLMRIVMDASPSEPVVPEGIVIRPINMPTEFEAALRTIRTSFRDHYGFVEEPFDQTLARWQHMVQTDPHFDPSVWYLALEGKEVAGVCYCTPHTDEDPEMAWVNTLGVCREWRGRGIGEALLRMSFAEFYRRGFKKVGLGVDSQSLTGATKLYEKAGMQVFREFHAFEKEIRPGFELSTQALGK